MSNKIKVIILFGGRSAEHEISRKSCSYVVKNLNPKKYEIDLIGIDIDGRWYRQDIARGLKEKSIFIYTDGLELDPSRVLRENPNSVVFPILHGTFGEDGTLQGMLDLFDMAYVGADTLGSSIGMDKIISKKLAASENIPIVPYIEVRFRNWTQDKNQIVTTVSKQLGFPVFVKPARLGSSIGISKVKSMDNLASACDDAFLYDDKLLIEKGLLNAREIECAVIGDGDDPQVSFPGEVIVQGDEFYSYDAKYISESSALIKVPADLSDDFARTAQLLSKKIFKALNLYGMARVDLFLENENYYFNEVNTIPGFTEISQFPLLWQHEGFSSEQIIDKLIDTAFDRKRMRLKLKRNY